MTCLIHRARVHWLALLTTVLGALLAVPHEAAGQEAETLDRGLELYNGLEYEQAAEVLNQALREPHRSTIELLQIYSTLGATYVFLERQDEAKLALRRLLCLDEDFRFDEFASPRIRRVFRRVQHQWEANGKACGQTLPATLVTVNHEAPRQSEKGQLLALRFQLSPPDHQVNLAILHYRITGQDSFWQAESAIEPTGTVQFTIPALAVKPPATEYFLEILDPLGNRMTTLGTSGAPVRVPVPEAEPAACPRSPRRNWLLWTVVGVSALGLGLALGLVLGLGLERQNNEPSSNQATVGLTSCDGTTGVCFR